MTYRYTRAALTSAGLSALFLIIYGGCLIITSHRTDVAHFYFDWETRVPFVPLMVIPYLSIDLFFVAAPFICTSDAERRRFAKRVVLTFLVAGACYLLFPLKLDDAFRRPPVDGILGVIFTQFKKLDLPYNLAPSLHIALRAILAALYARHLRGVWSVLSHAWFVLIGFSTLLVWQHHAIDIITGFILAAYVSFIFPEKWPSSEVAPNRIVAFRYGAAAAVIVLAAWLLRPWGAFLLWPAIACGIMAYAYLVRGASIFHKLDGRVPLATRLVLGPVLIGQWISLRYYRRQCRPWDEVARGVWIGRVLDDREAADAVAKGVTAVLDLTGEFSEALPFRNLRYLNIPVMDLTAPTQRQLRAMSDFIAAESARGIVYVHCKIGYSRSVAAVAAHLCASGNSKTADDAIAAIRRVRPSIVVRGEIHEALRAWQCSECGGAPLARASADVSEEGAGQRPGPTNAERAP